MIETRSTCVAREASAGEVPTVESVALVIYEALKESHPEAFIYREPSEGRTTVDGRFDLRFVAAQLLRRFGTFGV